MMAEDKIKRCTELVDKTKTVVREALQKFTLDELAITWTGGKDSTTTLWIITQVCREENIKLPRVMTIDEYDSFQEIHDFIDKYTKEWNLDVEWCRNDDVVKAAGRKLGDIVRVQDLSERNQAELKRIGFEENTFPFEAESYVGNHLMKTVVFNMYIERHGVRGIFQGLRWDEHPDRRNDDYFEKREAAHLVPEHTRIKPILHFTERDIWDNIMLNKLPYCPLYEKGYRSLGAKTTVP